MTQSASYYYNNNNDMSSQKYISILNSTSGLCSHAITNNSSDLGYASKKQLIIHFVVEHSGILIGMNH